MRVWALLLLTLASCSFTRVDVADCRDSTECRAAFGFGWICGGDGLCAQAAPEPRCNTTWPADLLTNPAQGRRLVVGTIIDTSLETHVARANATQLAIQDASSAGGVAGREYGLIVCSSEQDAAFDGRTRTEATVHVARYLDSVLDVPIVVGPYGSGETEATFEATQRLVMISPSATSPTLTDLEPVPASDDAPGRLWRTAPTDVEQAAQIAADLAARSVTNVAFIAQRGAYGDGLVALLEERIAGLQVVRFESAGQLSSALGVVADGSATEVIFASSSTADSIDFLTAVEADATFDGRRFFLTDAAANTDLLAGLPSDAGFRDRIRGTRPSLDPVRAAAFERRYRVAYGENDIDALSFTAHAYDAGWLATYALAWATLQEPRIDARALGRGLRRLSEGTEIDVGELSWPDVITAFAAGESVNVGGASGALDYDPDTEERAEEGMSFEVWIVASDASRLCRADDTECP
ncbi:MAG: ABC transporter substrate-binding protein [Sandaracinus sp.]|nr:ABC transporter substrate-binding protein [Sandaracinus sp.]